MEGRENYVKLSGTYLKLLASCLYHYSMEERHRTVNMVISLCNPRISGEMMYSRLKMPLS